MGARHSKRSVDITTTPKKGEDGAVVADGDDAKLEKVAEPDLKVATNGGLHSEIEFADKEETSKDDVEDKEKNGFPEEPTLNEPAEAKADEEAVPPKTEEAATQKIEEAAEPKKKKDKKKKWSFRSISFSRKDKSKPAKEGSAEKNGDVPEVAEESAESDKSPSADEDVTPALTNGDSGAPDPSPAEAATPEPVKAEEPPTEAEPVTVEDTKVEPIKVEDAKPVESPKEEPVKVEEEPLEVGERLEEAKAPEPCIEVGSEEEPPPLPASNPPSPVTVFAESTKAEAALTSGQVPLEEALLEEPVSVQVPVEAQPDPSPSIEELPPAPPSPVPAEPLAEVEPPAEPAAVVKEEEPTTPPPTPSASVEMTLPAPEESNVVSSPVLEEAEETVAPADSLQDISTESLPSLPEPVSESLAPLSLPPVDFVPAPIADSPSPPVAEEPATPLTNGNVNGHSSPSPIEETTPPGPPKQIIAETVKECEVSHEAGDKPAESTVAKAEE